MGAGAAAASKPSTLTRLAAMYQERTDICVYRARCLRARRRADTTAAREPNPIMVQVAGSGRDIVPGGGDPGGESGGDPGGVGDPGGCPGGGVPGGVDPGGVSVDGPPGPGKTIGKEGVKKGGLKTGASGPVSTAGSGVGAGAKAPSGMSRTAGGVSSSGLAASVGRGRSRTVESTRSCGPLVLVRCRVRERLPGERCANNPRGSFNAAMIFFPTAWLKAWPPGSVTATKVRPKRNGASKSVRFEGTRR